MPLPISVTRRVAAVALVTAAALALAGCATPTSASPGTHATAHSTVVDTLYGKVTVPANPKRIVALDFPEATALADLGIKPVGIGSYIPALPAYTTFFKGVPNVTDSAGDPALEKIAAQKPDLILDDEFTTDVAKNKARYEQLSAIAPTVVLTWTEAAGSWQEDAAGTAQAVGKVAQMNTLTKQYEAKAAGIKKTYASVLSSHTVDLVSGDADSWYLYGASSSHGKVLAAAGAHFAAAAGQKDSFVQYSPERYGLLSHSDLLLVEATSGITAKSVMSDPVFASLPTAKNGDVFTTPYFFPSSYRMADALLDDFARALKKVK
ncbi:MAG: hypothetical protein JWP75_1637 [Frondihabitans sp.]|nr:hypothetical protein [Frondihabitans sp.]